MRILHAGFLCSIIYAAKDIETADAFASAVLRIVKTILLHSLFNRNCASNGSANHRVVTHAMSKKFTVTRSDLQ